MQNDNIHVFVGLGNPGKKYEMTRHNLGYLAITAFAAQHGMKLKEEPRFQAYMAKGQVEGKDAFLLMPTTYMNESGRSVRAFVDYYKVDPRELIVVADDIALEFGMMRLRTMGSAGGHNGLKSIEAHLGTTHYPRLRLGIGENQTAPTLADHVLDNFNVEELERLPEVLSKAALTLKQLLTQDLIHVMNRVNTKVKPAIAESPQSKVKNKPPKIGAETTIDRTTHPKDETSQSKTSPIN